MRAPRLDILSEKDIFLDGQHLQDLTENGETISLTETIVNFQKTSTPNSDLHHIRFMARNGTLHSNKGPAYIVFHMNGNTPNIRRMNWCQYGELHNTKGPAALEFDSDGNTILVEYYLNHKRISLKYFEDPYKPTEEELFMMLMAEQ